MDTIKKVYISDFVEDLNYKKQYYILGLIYLMTHYIPKCWIIRLTIALIL